MKTTRLRCFCHKTKEHEEIICFVRYGIGDYSANGRKIPRH